MSFLTDKVAIVTGGSHNLGQGIAQELGKMGADMVVQYHSESSRSKAENVAENIRSTGSQSSVWQADISNEGEVSRLYDHAVRTFGKVDIVVNTAGTFTKKDLVESTLDDYSNMFDVNAKGAFFMLKYAARRVQDGGRVINISSSLTQVSRVPKYSVYAASKAAAEQLVKFAAAELGNKKITVNTVSPGPIDNDFLRSGETKDSLALLEQLSTFSRLGEEGDVVPLVVFLVSNEAGWITGQNIRVNGGMV